MKRHVRPALVAIFAVCTGLFVLGGITAQQQQADPPKPSFSGKVVSVADGDTITVLLDNQQHRIRLEGIDCPESHQAFGTKATKAIADKVFGKEVTIKWTSRDKYKRILGHVYLGDRHINLEMVQEGWAWHYVQYSKDPVLAKAEKDARAAKSGLWVDPNPIAPWDFRHGTGQAKAGEVQPGGKDVDLAKTTVYVTKTGQKYHREGCRYLSKSKIPTSLGDAVKRYGPCSVCKPPALDANAPAKGDEVQKGEAALSVDAAYLGKAGLKLKSFSQGFTNNPAGRKFLRLGIVMEVEKELQGGELAQLKELVKAGSGKIRFVPLDPDGVAISAKDTPGTPAIGNWLIEGEVTGMKGDAFRIVVSFDSETTAKVRRVVVRAVEPVEEKK